MNKSKVFNKKELLSFLRRIFLESSFSRFLDTVVVIFSVLALSFFLIRGSFTIISIDLVYLSYIFFIVLFALKISSCRNTKIVVSLSLFFAGCYFFFFSPIWKIFPSIASPRTPYFSSLLSVFIFYFLIFSFLLRSCLTKNKFLLRVIIFFSLVSLFSSFLGFQSLKRSFQNFNENFQIKLEKPIRIESGDPLASLKLNPSITTETLEREKNRLGIGQPVWKQYLLWLDSLLIKADLGTTQQGQPVLEAVLSPLLNTLVLNLLVLVVNWLIALVLGSLSALYKDKIFDRLILSFSSISLTVPAFLLAILILGFCVKIGIGRIGGLTSVNFDHLNLTEKIWDILNHLFWPVLVMCFVSSGSLIRQFRGNILDVLGEDYVRVAKSRGLKTFSLMKNYVIPNAINPLVTLLGFEFASLLSGSALTEMILAYPGIGSLTLEAAKKMDINLIMFSITLGVLMLVVGNLLADLGLRILDPRTRI